MTPVIRAGRADDLAALLAIYNGYVATSPATFDLHPQSLERRRAWFAQFAERGPHRLLVAERGGAPVGYAGTTRFRAKPAYDTSVETTVYVAPEHAGHGIGTRLYAALFEALAGEDLHRAFAGVTLPNDASLALHRRAGFVPIGVFSECGRKFGRYWDVQWLARTLP